MMKRLKVILIVLIMLLSLGFSASSQEKTEKQQSGQQNDAFDMQLEAKAQITEFEIRNEYIKKTERENTIMKIGYIVILALAI